MIAVFLRLYFKMLRDLLKFVTDRAIQEWKFIFPKGRNYADDDTERGDFYVKEFINNLTEERGYEHDPYVIDDRMYSFFRIPVLAEAMHLGTYIKGLKSLHRADICAISGKTGKLSIDASLGAGPLDLVCIVFVRFAHIERLLEINLSLNYCKVHTNFTIDARTGRNGILQSVCIDELKGVSFSITGFGWWLCLPSLIMTFCMNFLKSLVRNLLEFKLEQHVSGALPSYQFPIEGTVLANTLISEHANVDNGEDSDSTEIDGESLVEHLQRFSSKTISPKHTTKLEKPIWCTNLPLFEDIVEEGICNDEYDESDISIQFQFSKDNVVQADIEPLTRSERPTCCVFFRSEELQFCNEASESFKSNITKVSGYEDLKDKNLIQNSLSEAQFENCSPVKYSKDLLGLLARDLPPVVSGGTNLSGSEGTTTRCNLEATDEENDELIRRFLDSYPNFVAFTRHSETGNSNEKYVIDAEIKIPTDENNFKVCTTINDERDSDHQEIGSQNRNPIGISMPMNNASEFIEEKYLELCELKTAYEKKTVECSYLYKDALNFGNSSMTCKTPRFNKDPKQNITQNFNQVSEVENEDFITQNKYLLDGTLFKNPVRNSSISVEKTLKDFIQMEHVESILKWEDENTEKTCTLESKNFEDAWKMSSQKSMSSLHRRVPSLVKDTLVKMAESSSTDETGISLKMSPGLREENNNEIESSLKYDKLTIDQCDAIGDSVFRCFDNPYNPCTNPPETNFYFPDSESTTCSEMFDSTKHRGEIFEQFASLENSSLRKFRRDARKCRRDERKYSVIERFQDDGTNDNELNNFKHSFGSTVANLTNTFDILYKEVPIASSEQIRLNVSSESLNEDDQFSSFAYEQIIGNSLKSLREGYNQTKDSEKVDALVSKEELNSDIYNTEPELVDDYSFGDWISDNSDDPSVNVSSGSDKEEVDVGKSILCKEFEYINSRKESETKLADPVIGVEKVERPSSVEIAENSGSEETLLNSSSSTLNTESLNSLNDSNGGTISQETLVNTGEVNIQIEVRLDALDNDSLVKLDEKSTDSYNMEAMDCSTTNLAECTTNFGLEEAYSRKGRESDMDCMKMTESDNMDARTSKDEFSVELRDVALGKSFEGYLSPSLHEDDRSICRPRFSLIKAKDIKYMQEKTSSLPKAEKHYEIPKEERIHTSGFNKSIEDFINLPDKSIKSFLSDTNESNVNLSNVTNLIENYLNYETNTLNEFDSNDTKTVLLRQAMEKLDRINDMIDRSPVCLSDDQLCANILPVAMGNFASGGLVLEGNEDNTEDDLVPRNYLKEFKVGSAVETCDKVHNIDLLPEYLNAETAYIYPNDNDEFVYNKIENVISSGEEANEVIRNKLLQGKLASEGSNEKSSFNELSNLNIEDLSKNTMEVCLDKNVLQNDIESELAKNETEQIHPDVTITSEPLENQHQTRICGGNLTASVENSSCSSESVEIKTILKQSLEKETEPVNIDKEQAND